MPTKSGLTPYFMNAVQMEPERLRRKVFVEQMGFKSGVKGWVSDGLWEQWWDCDKVKTAYTISAMD